MGFYARKIFLLVMFIAVAVVFGLIAIPVGIGNEFALISSSVSPRLVPQLATLGVVLALLYGLFEMHAKGRQAAVDEAPFSSAGTYRTVSAMLICLAFAFWGFQWLGFYAGGALMLLLLTLLLGERHVLTVLLVPTATALAVYIIFELGFQITLPKPGFLAEG